MKEEDRIKKVVDKFIGDRMRPMAGWSMNHLLIDFVPVLLADLRNSTGAIGSLESGKFVWNIDGGPEKWRERKEYEGPLFPFPPNMTDTTESLRQQNAELTAENRELRMSRSLRQEQHDGEIAELTAQRDTAWDELRKIREVIKANPEESTFDEISSVVAQRDAATARYQYLLHNMGTVEAHAAKWIPGKHKPLMAYLHEFINAEIANGKEGS